MLNEYTALTLSANTARSVALTPPWRVISSPDKVHGAEYDGPWIMTFDNFLDDFAIKQLLLGASYGEGFIRSTDQGRVNPETGEMVRLCFVHIMCTILCV